MCIMTWHICFYAQQKSIKKNIHLNSVAWSKVHPENTSPFLQTIWGQSAEGAFAQIFNLSGAYNPLPQFFAVFNNNVDNNANCHSFWKNGSFAECVPQKITGACVDSKPRHIEYFASSVVAWDKPM